MNKVVRFVRRNSEIDRDQRTVYCTVSKKTSDRWALEQPAHLFQQNHSIPKYIDSADGHVMWYYWVECCPSSQILVPYSLTETQQYRNDTANIVALNCILLDEKLLISVQISLKFVPRGSTNKNPVLNPIMACWQAIIGTNDGLVYWSLYVSLALNGLIPPYRDLHTTMLKTMLTILLILLRWWSIYVHQHRMLFSTRRITLYRHRICWMGSKTGPDNYITI